MHLNNCTWIHLYACMHAHTHNHANTHTQASMPTHMHVCMHVAVCVHTSTYKKEKVKEEREADMKTKNILPDGETNILAAEDRQVQRQRWKDSLAASQKTDLQFPPAVNVHGVLQLLLQSLASCSLPQQLTLDVVHLTSATITQTSFNCSH